MKLTWKGGNVTTPGEIESHNNMVETLWKWRHAGLVIETEQGERLPELIDTPKRVIRCECGNDDLTEFTLISLFDVGLYSMCRYEADGRVSCSWDETDVMDRALGIELGICRMTGEKFDSEGNAYEGSEWLWILKCHKCKKREKIWGGELDSFVDFC